MKWQRDINPSVIRIVADYKLTEIGKMNSSLFSSLEETDAIKFVIISVNDLAVVEDLQRHNWAAQIVISPIDADLELGKEIAEEIIIRKLNFHLSLQMHKLLGFA